MSYANGTPFLNLPQTVGTDKRDWADTNAAFLNLDGKVKSAYDGAIDTATALADLTEVVSGISSDVSDLQTTVGSHTTSIGTINEALTLINTALTSLNTTIIGKFDSAGIADPYDVEHGIYAIDDVVTYNGQRYVCNTAVTAAEPFDTDKWTAVDIQAELDQINSNINGLKFNVTDLGTQFTVTSQGEWIYAPNAVMIQPTDLIELRIYPNTANGKGGFSTIVTGTQLGDTNSPVVISGGVDDPDTIYVAYNTATNTFGVFVGANIDSKYNYFVANVITITK